MDKEQRAAEANFLLNHKLVKEALTAIREDIIRNLESCPLRDKDGQHELTLLLQIAGRFERELKSHLETGALNQPSRIDNVRQMVKRYLQE